MRPGPRLAPALGVLFALAVLVPVWTPLAFVVAAALLLLLAVTLAEALLLRRVAIEPDAAEVAVLPLGEPEVLSFALRTRSARPLHLTVRQVRPTRNSPGRSSTDGPTPSSTPPYTTR
jgi:hypothetical protein